MVEVFGGGYCKHFASRPPPSLMAETRPAKRYIIEKDYLFIWMSAPLQVTDATISLIEPIVIPDLFSKYSDLTPAFSFLGSVESYSRYYTDLENPGCTRSPAMIPELDYLLPLRKKHSLHSYWRYYRLSIQNAEREGESKKDLFLFLPLEIYLDIKPITVNNQSLMTKVHVYLFPFGACTINMDVKVPSLSLADFIRLIPWVKGANIDTVVGGSIENAGTFTKLALSIANQISAALFECQRTVLEFPPHTLLFVRKTSPDSLNETFLPHKRAIAAAMAGQSLDNIPLQENSVESYFQAKLKPLQLGEILMFSPIGSFFYMSPFWAGTEKKLQEKAKCMRNNYQSCLTLLFAVNRFLAKCTPARQADVPKERLDPLKNAFKLAFTAGPSKKTYFDNVYAAIAPLIGLDKSMKELGQAWGWT